MLISNYTYHLESWSLCLGLLQKYAIPSLLQKYAIPSGLMAAYFQSNASSTPRPDTAINLTTAQEHVFSFSQDACLQMTNCQDAEFLKQLPHLSRGRRHQLPGLQAPVLLI